MSDPSPQVRMSAMGGTAADEMSPVALVTGGGTGIGQAVALRLMRDGFTVIVTGRRADALRSTVEQADGGPGRIEPYVADVTQPASVHALFDHVVATHGRLDVLFNNAGINQVPGDPGELDVASWRAVMDTNVTGAFFCLAAAFRVMKAQRPQGGRIINNGSLSAHVPRPLSIAYTASKHAVTGLTKATALDGRPYGIACGQIDIGNAATALLSGLGADGALQADGGRKVEAQIPVEHVAHAVSYMASLPLDANVLFLTVMASGMPFVGRG